MLNDFKSFIRQALHLSQQEKYLLAVSGGIDSIVMTDLFSRAGLNFDIIHCNFKLRGSASDEDENFVIHLAQKYGVDYKVETFNTRQYADEQGISIQMAARNQRYAWFEKLLKVGAGQEIATAHHKNDVLETMIFNLAKGTGLSGLHGIRHRQQQIIRPMLFADKQEIRDYAHTHQLRWREDSSNADDKYRRNLIRHEIIPVMEQINPSLFKTLENTLERLIGAEALVQASCRQVREKSMIRKGEDAFIQTDKLLNLPGLNVVLHDIFKDYGFQYHQSREVARMLKEKKQEAYVGKVFDSASHRINLDRSELLISPLPKEAQSLVSVISEQEHIKEFGQFDFSIRVLDARRYSIMPLPNVAALDHEKLKFPLKLRKWKQGDIFYPLGMNCRKKLSDFMIDTKIPLNLKERVFVLISGDDIVWVVGHRIDHRYRITDNTQQVYEVTQHMRR